jgi:cation:H+ antiporter
MAVGGTLSRLEGGVLLALFLAYMLYVGWETRRESVQASALAEKERALLDSLPGARSKRPGRDLVLAIAGTAVLVVGAQMLVGSATSIARAFGVPEVIIGMTLVAFGTSVPELAASVVASLRGEAQIVIGNIVGSNIFNASLILGTAALVRPLPIDPSILRIEGPLMLALSLILLPFTFTSLCLNRLEGGALLASYGVFVVWIVI